MGFDLYPSFIALMQFGDRWLVRRQTPRRWCWFTGPAAAKAIPLSPAPNAHPKLEARAVQYRDGPGAGRQPAKPGPQYQARVRRRAAFMLGRPSSVSRALQIIGDKWSFMVVREAFFGNRRYDKIQSELGIAPNILTDRLSRLVAQGVFHRRLYQTAPERYEYLLTDMGRDLYGPFVAMLAWGDRWLSKGKPPLLLSHVKCGHDFHASVICDQCQKPIIAADMQYRLSYDPGLRRSGPRSVSLRGPSPDGSAVPRLQRFHQLETHDLAGSRARNFRNDMGRLGNFVGRQAFAAMREQRVHVELALFGDDKQIWHFAQRRMRHADHRAIDDLRMQD